MKYLGIVQSTAVGLPRVDEAVGYGVAFGVKDLALDPHVVALAFRRDGSAIIDWKEEQ